MPAGQIIPDYAAIDVAITWRMLFDRDYISTAIDSGNIVYAGKDDIAGELCNTVIYVRVGEDSGSTVDWYWISVKTGLPRAVQRDQSQTRRHAPLRPVHHLDRAHKPADSS